jgi:hypothetical protein
MLKGKSVLSDAELIADWFRKQKRIGGRFEQKILASVDNNLNALGKYHHNSFNLKE